MGRRRADQNSAAAPTFRSAGERPAATGLTAVHNGASAVVARVPTSGKPLYPRGAVSTGTLTRTGSTPLCGVLWLDRTGTDQVLVRLSRSAGLPPGLPDVNGVAIRVGGPASGGDLLLSNTGTRALTRFVRAARRSVGGFHTYLPPNRTASGRGANHYLFETPNRRAAPEQTRDDLPSVKATPT